MTTRPVMSASRVASLVALVRSQGRADGANLALVLLPVLLVPATHAGQNQSRRPT